MAKAPLGADNGIGVALAALEADDLAHPALEVLHEPSGQGVAFHLVSMEGGTAHNAIPREAEASLLTADIASLHAKAEALADGLGRRIRAQSCSRWPGMFTTGLSGARTRKFK
ncbi:MAG: hypothetical protein LBU45_00350 [Azoarcus sp.]|jgi:hypothetical protein|nr:hypothetical protein [Azoarcus sp.]